MIRSKQPTFEENRQIIGTHFNQRGGSRELPPLLKIENLQETVFPLSGRERKIGFDDRVLDRTGRFSKSLKGARNGLLGERVWP
jgi:hypothetical protein